MTKRVFIAGIEHETNSFSPLPTNLGSYEEMFFFEPRGTVVPKGYDRARDFVELARNKGYEVIRSISAVAQPAGPTKQSDYTYLRDRILKDLTSSLPIDIVFLVLHGAQIAEGCDDCEGDLIERTRQIVGPTVPIGVQIDLHANLSSQMVEGATAIIACKEYPHTDYSDRASELFELLENTVDGEISPVSTLRHIPMLGIFPTNKAPVRSLLNFVGELERRECVVSISLIHGFPWSDIEDAGASILVITDGDKQLGESIAEELCSRFFDVRNCFREGNLSIDEAISRARTAESKPVLIADIADNPGSGGGGDSTFLLRALIDGKVENAAVAMIYDPEAVDIAFRSGIGAIIPLSIGGKVSVMSGEPLCVTAKILELQESPAQQGLGPDYEPLGRSAAIEANGIQVVLNSIRQQTFSPDCFTALGIDIGQLDILVIKSMHHFYARFSKIAREILYCEAPGTANPDLRTLPYRNLRRPIWPLDAVSLDENMKARL